MPMYSNDPRFIPPAQNFIPYTQWSRQELLNYARFLEHKIQECLERHHQPSPPPKTPPVSDPGWEFENNGDNDGDDKTKNPSPAIYRCKRVVIYRGFFTGWIAPSLDRYFDKDENIKVGNVALKGFFLPELSTPLIPYSVLFPRGSIGGPPGGPPSGHVPSLPSYPSTIPSYSPPLVPGPIQTISISSGSIGPSMLGRISHPTNYLLNQSPDIFNELAVAGFGELFSSGSAGPSIVYNQYSNSKVLRLFCEIEDWEKKPGCPKSKPRIYFSLYAYSDTIVKEHIFAYKYFNR